MRQHLASHGQQRLVRLGDLFQRSQMQKEKRMQIVEPGAHEEVFGEGVRGAVSEAGGELEMGG